MLLQREAHDKWIGSGSLASAFVNPRSFFAGTT